MAKSKIYIKPENRGKFTAKAKAKGKGVQEYARQVLANKDNYSPSTVKQANFARNASKWKKEEGGFITKLNPQEEALFQKFRKTLPDNLQADDNLYDLRGYWDSEGRPDTFDYSQPKQGDGRYHAYSRHSKTGKILKHNTHPTFPLAISTPGYRPIILPDGNIYTVNPYEQMGTVPLKSDSSLQRKEGGQIGIYDVMPYSYYSMADAEQSFPEGGQVISLYDDMYMESGGKLNKLGVENSLWNNIRAKRGSGKKPTKEMLEQERKIRAQEKEYGGYAETGYPYSVQDNQNFYQTQIQFAQQSLIPNTGFTAVPIPSPDSINLKTGESPFVNPSPEYSTNSDSPVSKSPKDLLTGLSIPREQSSNKVPKSAGAKADIAGAAFNAAGTAMQALAPPDSKFGKAIAKGNSFAQAAEPLRALDMAVPGLGTAAVEAARLAGAITGGVQAKNEEIQTDRIEDTTAYLNRYDNMNFSKMNQGNYLSRYGSNIRSYQQGGQPRQYDMLIEEIFMDFDKWLSSGGNSGKKSVASDGANISKNNKQQEVTYLDEVEVEGSQEPYRRIIGFIDEYKDLDPVRKAKLAQKKSSPIWRKSNQQIEEENKQYDYVAKRLLDSLPKGKGKEKQLAKYDSLTPRERQIIEESKYADKFKKPMAYAANRRLNEISDLPLREQLNPKTLKEIETLYQKDGRLPFTAGTPLSYINPANVIGSLSPVGDFTQGNYEEATAKTAMALGLGAIGGGAKGNLLPLGGTESKFLNIMKSAQVSNATMRTKGHQIIKELNTKEGKRRLKNQFQEANPDLTEEQLNYLVKARLEEVEKSLVYNPGRMLQDKRSKEIIIPEDYSNYFPKMNAHYSPTPLYNFTLKEAPEQLFPHKPDLNFFGINLQKDTGTQKFLNPNIEPGYITLGRGLEQNVKVLDHEIGHAIQKGGELPLDNELKDLIDSRLHYHTSSLPKGVLEDLYRILSNKSSQIQNDLSYFINAGGRTYKNEAYPFLREQRRKMLETGIIKDIYEEITVPKLIEARLKALLNKEANFVEGDRLIKMVAPWKYGKLKDLMNKAPVIAPIVGLGTLGTSSQSPKMKNGGTVIQQNILDDFDIYLQQFKKGGKITSNQEITYTHKPRPGDDETYMISRTVTPYSTRRQIKLNTEKPESPKQVNFISNYANALGNANYTEYPTKVPFENEKHWNIDRFIIEPAFSGSEQLRNYHVFDSQKENKRNVLADMYKYYMLQESVNPWKDAKKFVRQEINPRVKGAYYKNFGATKNIPLPGYTGITSAISNSFMSDVKNLMDSPQESGFDGLQYLANPVSEKVFKKTAMDYLMNYKKLSRKEAKKYLENSKNIT